VNSFGESSLTWANPNCPSLTHLWSCSLAYLWWFSKSCHNCLSFVFLFSLSLEVLYSKFKKYKVFLFGVFLSF